MTAAWRLSLDNRGRRKVRGQHMGFVARVLVATVGVGVLFAASAFPDADAAVLCRKRSGRVVVADACGRKQAAITAEELGLVGPAGPPGAGGAPGAPGMLPYRLVDSGGAEVGVVLSALAERVQVVVAHEALARPVQLEVVDGLIAPGFTSDVVRYEAAGCTGPPFIPGGGSPLPRAILVGDTLYYASELLTPRSLASAEREDPTCTGGTQTVRGTCCKAESGTFVTAPASAVPFASLGFTEPFVLETRP